MKIVIGYPPIESVKGIPLLSQNRQFQWFNQPTFIYPVVPALAATILARSGFEVIWLDGIAQGWDYNVWFTKLKKAKPNLLFIETKTPVVKFHWKIINSLKRRLPRLLIVLAGDHVTALPQESLKNSAVDYILTGGDYDFLLLNLANHLNKDEKLKPGIWHRKKSKILNTGKFQLNHNLNTLPFIDRELTKWQLYAYQNGNYKRTPGTYIMAGRDCWWHRCAFCSWTTLYPQFRVRPVKNVLDEIGQLIEQYQIKEIMDDTGTFPVGDWLRDFCQGMIKRGYHKKINFNCNMRFGALKKKDYRLMARAGFRLLVYGLESGNQKTLDRLNKGVKLNQIEAELIIAEKASKETDGHLEPHVTCMVGYPWETFDQARKTIQLTSNLFQKELIDSLQATIVVPYPGTNLFSDLKRKNLLKNQDWNCYDMKESVIKTPISNQNLLNLSRCLYLSAVNPRFIFKKIISVRSKDDLKFLAKVCLKFFGHLADFS